MSIPSLCPFDHHPRTRLVFGDHCIERLGELAREIGGRHVLLVTDPGIEACGHHDRARRAIEGAGLKLSLFDKVIQNPTTHEVEECVEFARSRDVDLIVGLGGGSSMDTAKGCNFLLTNGGKMEDYWGVGKATQPMLPMIAVATTAGTGSECQSFALISQAGTHRKMACGDPQAAPRIALLDPTLTLTQPRGVAACTGIDAVAHAVETAVTTKRNPISRILSREAFRLTHSALPRVMEASDDLKARGAMLLGAALAGLAIENSMLGATHAAANPLTSRFGVVHGQAVGLMLPQVVRFNGQDQSAREVYQELAELAGVARDGEPQAEALANFLEDLLRVAGLAVRLSDLGIPESAVEDLAAHATEEWTGKFNPREVTQKDFERLYREVY